MKIKLLLTLSFLLTTRYLLPTTIYAVCPICTVAVIGGLGLSRWLGIDDAVSSIWIGGLILSSSFWLIDWLRKKQFKRLQKFTAETNKIYFNLTIVAFMYLIVIVPLMLEDVIGHPLNTILGIDKIIFGTILGSIVFLFGVWADRRVRKIKGRQLFIYQKVVFPVISLVITSLLVYYFGGYLQKLN
jgi:hypothetical protein